MKFLILLLPLTILFFCFMVFLFLIYKFYNGYRSLTWPHVQGNIIHRDIITEINPEGFDLYKILVTYSYTVNNVLYQSDQISLRLTVFLKKTDAENTLNQLGINNVKVFYNPNNHSQSVLIPGGSFFLEIVCFFGLLTITYLTKNLFCGME